MCLYLCLFLCFVPVFIWEPAVDTNNPNSKPISHSYVLPAYIVIIVTCFSRNEKPGFLILSILPYLINPLYAAVFPNSHHALSHVNALLPLTGLWHPALGSLPPTEAFLSLLGLLHSELSHCPAETLFSCGHLPFHMGCRDSSPTHPQGHLPCVASI